MDIEQTNRMKTSFFNVTEVPGQKASEEQFSIMRTRYHLAKLNVTGKSDVLEIACGSGVGLGYIAENANRVVGGDIDEKLLAYAGTTYENSAKVSLNVLDAQELPFGDNSFDLVIIFEAIYYFPQVEKVLMEVSRVLKDEGKLLISSVNKDWHGFNPSLFSVKYYSHSELVDLFARGNFKVLSYCGFEDLSKNTNLIVTVLKKLAVRFDLIPKTMKGKELLKRIFYGKLRLIPRVLTDDYGVCEELREITSITDLTNYKQLYYICRK